MEAPIEGYVNGGMEEQAAPQTLQELQAAVQDVHAMPVVVGAFQQALAEQAAAAGTPADQGMGGSEATPSMPHMGAAGGLSGRGRMSSGAYKSRSGPLFCQVEGCGMPLDSLKEYHQRYKVCEEHLKTPYIIRDGQQVRFCQQCGRFQPLEDFDDNKRSCRVRLQKHNARRRKRPRDGSTGAGSGGLPDYAADMAKLAAQAYAPAAVPISPKDIQAMQQALHFASTTLMNSNDVVTGKPAGEDGGDGAAGAGMAMGAGSMPFVPTPEVMMLLLKGYAAMFHYALDSATLRALASPSELPDQQGAATGTLGLGAIDALQMQQLMQSQGVFAGGAGFPLLLPGMDATAGLVQGADGGEEMEGQQEQGEQQQQDGEGGEEQQGGLEDPNAAQLTAEQVAAALMTQPHGGGEAGAAAAAAALAQAAYLTAAHAGVEGVAAALEQAHAGLTVEQHELEEQHQHEGGEGGADEEGMQQ